jgi:hypothetical protein
LGGQDFGSDDLTPDRAQAEDAVRRLAGLFPRPAGAA